MGMLLASVGALSTFYPDAKHIDDPEERYMAAIRLIAKVPTLAAWAYRHSMGLPYVYPDNELSYSENFLSMLFKMENSYEPDPRLAKALDVLFILHADHEQNCSTNAVRSVGSSGVDPYSAVAAGVAALYGPLHGGANEAVLRMLRRIETVENIPDFLEGVKNREEKLMGFGHRVYKNYDPRARIIKKHVDEVLEATGDNPLLDIATELEKRALDDDFFTSRKLYPNVDFYSGLIYEAMGIPTDMFTVIFAIPRTSGWVAQWMEQNEDPELKIARPRQIYTGRRDVDYTPADKREGPEKITGPPAKRPKKPAPRRLSDRGGLARAVRAGEHLDPRDPAVPQREQHREPLVDLHPAHAPDVALDHDHLLSDLVELHRLDQELVERRQQVAPVLHDALIAALKAPAHLTPSGGCISTSGSKSSAAAVVSPSNSVLKRARSMGARPPSGFSPQRRNASRTTSTFSLAIATQYPRLVCLPVSWKVTVRHGSNVGREKFASLDEAIDEARRRVEEIQREDRSAGDQRLSQAHARPARQRADRNHRPRPDPLPGGRHRRDGRRHASPYTGAIRKETIEADSLDQAFERLQGALGG